MDELIHELRSYAHQRLFDGSEKYDQHLLYLADMIEEEMANYVELPKDADGEYIHIGDVMEGEKIGGGYGEPFEVVGYVMSNGELEPMDEHRNPRKRKYSRHHHEPTVEEVMVDFAIDWECAQDGEDKTAVLKEYAKRLKLAGEVDAWRS